MTPKSILLIGLTLFGIAACSHDPLDVDPGSVSVDIRYTNLDSIFVHTDESALKNTVEKLGLDNNGILAYELGYCLRVGEIGDSGTTYRIKQFVNDTFVRRIEQRISEKFSDLSPQKQKISEGFRYLKFHFPFGAIPANVVFMNSILRSNVFCTEREIGIGLERYLGAKTDVIKEIPTDFIFQWEKDGMNAEFMPRDVLTAWIMTHYVPEKKGNTAEAMVRWGKIIYLTEAAFPHDDKNMIMRYSAKDYQWALDNEYAFWKYLVDEKLLFSESERDQSNFLNDGPFTIGLPEKGPDRLGQFLGWRMVHSYMKENPKTKLAELVNIPYNNILQSYEIAD